MKQTIASHAQVRKSPSRGTIDTTALRMQLGLVYATKRELENATAAQNKFLEDASSAMTTNLARVENMQHQTQCEKAIKSEVAKANENHARGIRGVSDSVQESTDGLNQANIKIQDEKATREELKTEIGTLTQQLEDSDKNHRADRQRLGEAFQDVKISERWKTKSEGSEPHKMRRQKAYVESRMSHIEEIQMEKADKMHMEQAMCSFLNVYLSIS